MRVDNRPRFSSAKQTWRTPEALYKELDSEFKFDLDPCPANGCEKILTEDGICKGWDGASVFCNPPYDDIEPWIAKHAEPKTAVYLLPSRTGSRWWHEYALKADEIRFVRGRLRFQGAPTNAPFDSVILVYKNE